MATTTTAQIHGGLKMVIYGQGSTLHRDATLIRFSQALREELDEVAQGQFYLLLEVAARRLIDELKSRPSGQMEVIDAASIQAMPATKGAAKKKAK